LGIEAQRAAVARFTEAEGTTTLSDTLRSLPNWSLPTWVLGSFSNTLEAGSATPAPTGPVVYYRDPDGEPFYSADPETTEDGRDYLPVRSGEDVSFDDPPLAVAAASESPSQETGENILYYRNPMGLPDTSPVPKKDSMGMDYIPVYEGEIDDTSSVTVSPANCSALGCGPSRPRAAPWCSRFGCPGSSSSTSGASPSSQRAPRLSWKKWLASPPASR